MMLINNQTHIESIIDPGSQIITMSNAICHDLGLHYDPQTNSTCNLRMVQSISHWVLLEISHVALVTSPSIYRFTSFMTQPTTFSWVDPSTYSLKVLFTTMPTKIKLSQSVTRIQEKSLQSLPCLEVVASTDSSQTKKHKIFVSL